MAASSSALTDPSSLILLLYRADWTRRCLSAEIASLVKLPRMVRMGPGEGRWRLADEEDEGDGEDPRGPLPRSRDAVQRLLVAPGGRYRIEDISSGPNRCLAVSDGETCWRVMNDQVHVDHYHGLNSELIELLDPSWLLSHFDLELAGAAEAAGRPACRVAATPRQLAEGPRAVRYHLFDRIDVLADAELGILLRREAFSGAKPVELMEVRSLTLDPAEADDPAQFRPPPSLPVAEDSAGSESFFDTSGPGWSVVKTGARAAGAVLTFAVRHVGGGPATTPAEAVPPMPEPGQPPGAGDAAPLSDDLINLLHRTGLPPQRFAAGVRKWTDEERVFHGVAERRATLPRSLSGIFGPDGLWEAMADRQHQRSAPPKFQTARFRLAMPGRYRIDFLTGDWQQRVSACDGERVWTAFSNRVVSQPAEPLRDEWARLADPAWLLGSGWQLTAGGAEDLGGRRGWRIWADAGSRHAGPAGLAGLAGAAGVTDLFRQAVVTVDAELGIVLRLTYLVDSRPAICLELHDVSVPPAGDPGDFRIQVPPGTRVVEGSGLLALLDIPAPLHAAWTAGKAGVAGASAVAGWLQQRLGKPGERDRRAEDDQGSS